MLETVVIILALVIIALVVTLVVNAKRRNKTITKLQLTNDRQIERSSELIDDKNQLESDLLEVKAKLAEVTGRTDGGKTAMGAKDAIEKVLSSPTKRRRHEVSGLKFAVRIIDNYMKG